MNIIKDFEKIKIKENINILLNFIRLKKIPTKEIEYMGFSTLDPLGRVFKYKGDIYRGIYSDKQEYVNNIFKCGLYQELYEKKLFVKTEFAKYRNKNFSIVLKHKRLTTSLPTEWTANMLKDASLLILKVNEVCNKYGYELGDAHPYNVLFDGFRPVWVDFGSIVPKNQIWRAYPEFINFTIVPLVYMINNELYEAYSILQSERTYKIASKDFRLTILYKNFLELCGESEEKINGNIVNNEWVENSIKNLKSEEMFWSNYQKESDKLENDMKPHKNNHFNRFFKLIPIIKEYSKDSKSMIDLAGNMGLFSIICSKKIHFLKKIINTDYDYYSIEKSYFFLKSNNIETVNSYLLNFMSPIHHWVYRNFKSDIVVALAITHHLLLTQGFKIDEIFEKIKSFSNKYVYIEFMPLGLWGGDINNKPIIPDWYTEDWFERNFCKYFYLLNKIILETHIICGKKESHRVLFIGRIK